MNAVAAVEFRRVQRFVFSTSRLLDAVGRSALIATLTDPAHDQIQQLLRHHHCRFLGGGVSSLYVDAPDPAAAQGFVADWTRLVRDHADTAQITATVLDTTEPVTPATIAAALYTARSRDQISHQPTLSTGFTTDCVISGAPADTISPGRGTELLASNVTGARTRARTWHAALDTDLSQHLPPPPSPDGRPRRWAIPAQLDLLADDRGDVSRLAVLHLDIDGLGDRLRNYTGGHPEPDQFTAANTARLRLQHLMQTLIWHLLGVVAAATAYDTHRQRIVITGFPIRLAITIAPDPDRVWLPVRPVVAAGDDATVICDHRLAWSLALAATEWVSTPPDSLDPDDPRRRLADLGHRFAEPLTVSVGIAEFPTGSPLSVAYERAETMTRYAKTLTGDSSIAWDTTSATPPPDQQPLATAQPYTATDLRYLLDQLLGDHPGSLRRPGISRSSIKQAALTSPAQLWRSMQAARVPDPISTDAILADAIELLDRHLHLPGLDGDR